MGSCVEASHCFEGSCKEQRSLLPLSLPTQEFSQSFDTRTLHEGLQIHGTRDCSRDYLSGVPETQILHSKEALKEKSQRRDSQTYIDNTKDEWKHNVLEGEEVEEAEEADEDEEEDSFSFFVQLVHNDSIETHADDEDTNKAINMNKLDDKKQRRIRDTFDSMAKDFESWEKSRGQRKSFKV
ncbi:hypothetical protein SUGI_0659380 [Cryptomeria japonica]|nr:hypothetical protein SUGI_0659380 [Cryptomeria japonica]